MLSLLQESFAHGQKAGVVVRSEGAIFSTNFLKETIEVLLKPKREVRETVLGHLQRGGSPTAFERTLATRMGVKAIQLLEGVPPEPHMVGLSGNEIKPSLLTKSLEKIRESRFQEELSFNTKDAFHLSRRLENPPKEKSRGVRIAILTDGDNVSGMNMATRAVARLAMNEGIEIMGIKGGFLGFAKGSESVFNLEWNMLEMKGILRRAGTLLGVSGNDFRANEEDFLTIKKHAKNLKIDGIIAIGDNKTFQHSHKLSQIVQLPVVGIPAAFNCNLPGTNWVIGMDSTLNDLLRGIDRAAEAAHVQKKIFLIHLKGEYCRCLVMFAALGGGAEKMIIDDREPDSDDQEVLQNNIRKNIKELKSIIDMGKSFATIVFFSKNTEKANDTIKFIKQTLDDYGIDLGTTVIPFETSYGGSVPTAFDRVLAKRFGEKAILTLQKKMDTRDYSFHIVGIRGKDIVSNSYQDMMDEFYHGCPRALTSELQSCFDLMSQPNEVCIGMGGDVKWIDTRDGKQWKGEWKCKKCGQSQTFSFIPGKMLCLYCNDEMCHNYGYIRISRRL